MQRKHFVNGIKREYLSDSIEILCFHLILLTQCNVGKSSMFDSIGSSEEMVKCKKKIVEDEEVYDRRGKFVSYT